MISYQAYGDQFDFAIGQRLRFTHHKLARLKLPFFLRWNDTKRTIGAFAYKLTKCRTPNRRPFVEQCNEDFLSRTHYALQQCAQIFRISINVEIFVRNSQSRFDLRTIDIQMRHPALPRAAGDENIVGSEMFGEFFRMFGGDIDEHDIGLR